MKIQQIGEIIKIVQEQQQPIQEASKLRERMKHGKQIIYMIQPEIVMNGHKIQLAFSTRPTLYIKQRGEYKENVKNLMQNKNTENKIHYDKI